MTTSRTAASQQAPAKKVTVATLAALRARDEKAVFVTAYDYPTATYADRAGVDMLLVGDSAAMTVLGLPTTVGITLDEMLVFARAVCRGAKRAFVVGDLPFLSYQPSDEAAIRSGGAFIAAGCDAVKCEGGQRIAQRVRAMTDAGIAVMGHLGLTPQSLGQLGGYRVQGKTLAAVERLTEDALALQDAGAFSVLLEAVPAEAAAYVREHVDILVYGIGAGPDVDGQLVISNDALGNFVGDIRPRFVKRYADVGTVVEASFRNYASDVRAGRFPAPEHCYPIDPAEEATIHAARPSVAAAGKPLVAAAPNAPALLDATTARELRDVREARVFAEARA
jgi:3-methyl-2-oxobutanoate hydroxymethyltransferase